MDIFNLFSFFIFAGLGGANPTSTTLGFCDFINHMI
jgi:purine nucleoside permease